MRIPNIGGAASAYAGVTAQASKESTASAKSTASSAEAATGTVNKLTVEEVVESDATGDRDARERYEGPQATEREAGTPATEKPQSVVSPPSLFELAVNDDSPPPRLDTQA